MLNKLCRIDTVFGPWLSLGFHIDFKHHHFDIHFMWWIIVLGNTVESIHCGYCNTELVKNTCPKCNIFFDIEMNQKELLELVEMHISMTGAIGDLARAYHRAYTALQEIKFNPLCNDAYLSAVADFGMFEIDTLPPRADFGLE